MVSIPRLEGYKFEELKVGMSAVESRTITDTDLRNFAGVSGDTNPMHLNEEFAKKTMFKATIVHGMLTAALISSAVGNKLPGPGSIYVSQTLRFKAPVRIGDTVYAVATIRELVPEKRRVKLDTVCWVQDTPVIEGEAEVFVPKQDS